jgi:hypothetical protein
MRSAADDAPALKRLARRCGLFLLAAAAAGALLWWDLYRPGEARYRGRPTSAWVADYRYAGAFRNYPQAGGGLQLIDSRPQPFWARWLDGWGLDDGPRRCRMDWSLVAGDPDAVPVLLEMLRRPEPGARLAAAVGLAKVGEGHPAALPALRGALGDEDRWVRVAARDGLGGADGGEDPAP